MNELSTKTEKKMTTRQVSQICGVSIPTVTENAKKVGIVLENGKAHGWTAEELKKLQAQLVKNTTARGNAATSGRVVEETALSALKGGLTFQEIVDSGNIEAMKELTTFAMNACAEVARNKQLEEQNRILLEQKEQLQLDYQNEREEHQKDKELVLHKYLTATQIKETVWKEYGKSIVVSKIVKRIPLEDNDILYKPFKNGNFTGQQPVYHPNVLDKIREILG